MRELREHDIHNEMGKKLYRDNDLNNIFFHSPKGLIYHYTTIEVFWKIIVEQTFRAGHIRFSNDINEYKTGSEICNKFNFKNKKESTIEEKDIFIVCFCEDGDLLSQWRGYTPNSIGISIGFDFSIGENNFSEEKPTHLHLFNIHKNCDENKQIKKVLFSLNSPYKLIYINPDKDLSNNNKIISHSKIIDNIKYVKNKFDKDATSEDYISYMKHSAFVEENEYRIVFEILNDMGLSLNEYIHYIGNDQIKKPGIIVSMKKENDENCEYIKCVFRKENYENDFKTLDIQKLGSNWEDELRETINKGTSICDSTYIHIGSGSNQKDIFDKVFQMKEELNIDKIWCDGYLPIRKIIVSQCNDINIVFESIKNFCAKYHWLKFIDVEKSTIPYREKPK